MTNREFLNAVMNAEIVVMNTETGEENAEIAEELKLHAENELAKLDARNAKRASMPSKTALANAPLIEAVKAHLAKAEEPLCAAEIAGALELTSNKVASLIKAMDGVEVSEKHFNKRKVKAYALVKNE